MWWCISVHGLDAPERVLYCLFVFYTVVPREVKQWKLQLKEQCLNKCMEMTVLSSSA